MKMGDVNKVQDAGFRVFKVEYQKHRIMENSGHGSWKMYSTYGSMAATQRAWKKLMEDPKNIGD
jgi:hypothetical protein